MGIDQRKYDTVDLCNKRQAKASNRSLKILKIVAQNSERLKLLKHIPGLGGRSQQLQVKIYHKILLHPA